MNGTQLRNFMRECESCLDVDRPCLVLDCSKLIDVDIQVTQLLLACLEDAIKRNGDVRLACLSRDANATLQSIGVSSLFEIYGSTAEAISSFYSGPASWSPGGDGRGNLHQVSEIQS
jgi:anti-anti-sigma regulatory factor